MTQRWWAEHDDSLRKGRSLRLCQVSFDAWRQHCDAAGISIEGLGDALGHLFADLARMSPEEASKEFPQMRRLADMARRLDVERRKRPK